jgi:hypothetical protein
MEQMSHDQVAADIATKISENALSGAAAGANVLTSVAGLVPAGTEEVSTQLHHVARNYAQVDDRAAIILAW